MTAKQSLRTYWSILLGTIFAVICLGQIIRGSTDSPAYAWLIRLYHDHKLFLSIQQIVLLGAYSLALVATSFGIEVCWKRIPDRRTRVQRLAENHYLDNTRRALCTAAATMVLGETTGFICRWMPVDLGIFTVLMQLETLIVALGLVFTTWYVMQVLEIHHLLKMHQS